MSNKELTSLIYKELLWIKEPTIHKKCRHSTNYTWWRGCREKGALPHCWWECKLVQSLWRTVWSDWMSDSLSGGTSKKLKIKLLIPYDPAIPLLGIYPDKTITQKDTCTTMFIAPLFTIAKTWKQPKYPSADEWIKMWHIYTTEYYSDIKKNEITRFAATWIDLEIIILSQKEKDKYHMISPICRM